MSEGYLSSGEVARLVGRSRETLRRYEARGLIPRSRRDPVNQRRYWTVDEAETIRARLQPVARPSPSERIGRNHNEVNGAPGT